MKKIKILITTNFSFFEYKSKFNSKFNIYYNPKLIKNNLKKIIKNYDGWICSPSPKYIINKEILKHTKNLKCLITPSTGTNHIDINYCKKNNIKLFSLSNTKDVKKIYASSEFTFLLSLFMIKNLKLGIKNAVNYNWRKKENLFRGSEIADKKVSIIGFGRIGRNLARYFQPFKANVWVYDINKKNIPKYVTFSNNINEVILGSKIVIVCLKLNQDTYKFVGKKIFDKMDENTIFINTSRGEIIDEKILYQMLKRNKILGAALDVLNNEFMINKKMKNKLIEYSKNNDNLLITPHMAGLTYESETKAGDFAVNKINNFFK